MEKVKGLYCESCGVILKEPKCEYCGTIHSNFYLIKNENEIYKNNIAASCGCRTYYSSASICSSASIGIETIEIGW